MNKIKRMLSVVLTILIAVSILSPVAFADEAPSQSEQRVVKIAYPQQKFLSEIDENGNYTGYSYDYLNKIAEFANWRLEFVTYNDISLDEQIMSCISAVESGKADLLGVMLKSQDLEEIYLYPEQNYGIVYTTLDVLDSNLDVTEMNFMEKKPLRVAILETAKTRNAELETFVEVSQFDCEYVYCETMSEQIEALKNGSADAMLKVSLTFLPGLKQIAEFAPRPFYFVSGKGNEALVKELDEAIRKIHITDPYFENRLRSKYFINTMADFSLSEEESKFVKENPILKVLLFPKYAPFSFQNKDGELCGMSVSILNNISERTGIKFEYDVIDEDTSSSEKISSGKYDIIIGPPNNITFALNNSLVLSQPYLDVNITMFTNENSVGKSDDECILALIKDISEPIGYNYKEIRYYDNIEECLTAVNKGEADYGYANRYLMDYYTTENSHKNLKYLNLSRYNREIGFYVPNTSSCELLSIINKYVRSMSEKDIHSHLSLAQSQKGSGGLKQLINDNPMAVILITVAFLSLLMLTVMLAFYSRANKMRNIKLQLAYTAKSDFLARMSHDMRTPMNGIIGLTGLTLELDNLPDEVSDNLRKIDESAKFLLSLINDTLDMNKIESNKVILNFEPTDLHVFFDQMVSVVKVSAEQKNVKLVVSPSEELFPMVLMDKVRVQQIFFNLASNAIKFTPVNGTVTIVGECTALGEGKVNAKLQIKDTGIGISDDFMPRIFEPFEQENNSITANYTGTGLGLAIVKNLVSLMDGSITVKSEKGVGSEFIVELVFDVALNQKVADVKTQIPVDSLRGKRVLLCEDHPLNAQIATKLLERQGVVVEHAENGQDAVELFTKSEVGHYDAILMDIRMPIMDGISATKLIRALNRRDAKTTPIIAMTANAFDEDVKKSFDAGMNAHLAKPIEPKLLYQALKQFIYLTGK